MECTRRQIQTQHEVSLFRCSVMSLIYRSVSDVNFNFENYIYSTPFSRGSAEPVHCLNTYNNELISGTTGNRIGVHTSLEADASFSSTKLRSDAFRGLLTSMAVLPLNRLLLLGADNGNISLLC